MKDKYGNTMCEGDPVITVQQGGGFLPPAPPTKGVVSIRETNDGPVYTCKYYRSDGSVAFILLEGKINEIDLT